MNRVCFVITVTDEALCFINIIINYLENLHTCNEINHLIYNVLLMKIASKQ
jgi:hypothetical protein